jgi:hypothetical protein
LHIRTMWFDRLRQRIRDLSESNKNTLPGFVDADAQELDKDLDRTELLIINQNVAERLIENGSAPDDLKTSFQLPFENILFQVDPPVRLPKEHGELRGILVSRLKKRYRVHVWFEERRMMVKPRYNFTFLPGERLEGYQKTFADFLYWLAGYVNSPNLLAIRHNRPLGTIRRYLSAGRLAPSSYYTFESVPKPRQLRVRRRVGDLKSRVVSVHGHFRRAHWHNLPFGRGKRWYPTTWVRSHNRKVSEAGEQISAAA